MLTIFSNVHSCTRGPSQWNKVRKRNKRSKNWKGRSKAILIFRWQDCLGRKSKGIYRQNMKNNKSSARLLDARSTQ